MGYVLAYLMRGDLPWQGIRAKTKEEKYQKIMEVKIATTPEELFKGLPEEFVTIFQYCRSLQFDEKPDYAYVKSLFKKISEFLKFDHDYNYDWNYVTIQKESEEKMKQEK